VTEPEGGDARPVTPDGQHISVIRVESDSTQRLWRLTLDGRQPEVVLPDEAGQLPRLGRRALALFVLGQRRRCSC
jgi:hypothetical protein